MASNEFPALLLFQPQSGDKLTLQNGNPIANTIQCPNSHTATVTAGFESNLMAIGMTQHLDPSISVRQNLYTAQTAAFVTQLQQDAGAIVVMPHTEAKGKTVATLKDLNLDGIEIYNLHANINPKARANDLGFTYFKGLMDLLVYWIDPFGDQQPDLAFLSFLQVSDVYAKKWDRLIAQGQHVTGLAGNDGHQALFPGNASDGDKIDSFRRTTRWVTQHYLVPDLTLTSMKSAIKNGRGWVVFEGLGSPSGFDFNGTNPVPTTADMGDTLSLAQGTITLHVASPSLNKQSPQDKQSPAIRLNLIYVDSNGSETIVATSQSGGIDYVATQAGAYRVEVWITPLHLTSFIGYKKELAQKAFKWIITNHIYVSS
jgi:hypothetical protein